MALDDFIVGAKAAKVGSDSANIDGTRFPYDILPASFQPDVPFFVGFPKNYLFISEQVPEEFRRAVLAHEVKCAASRAIGMKPYCCHAIEQELKFVRGDMSEYLTMRLKMFEALLIYYKDSTDIEFIGEITKSRDRFKGLVPG